MVDYKSIAEKREELLLVRRAIAQLFVEWGYKARDEGWSLERTLLEFRKLYDHVE